MTEATSSSPRLDLPALDALTGGAFTAPTSGERATRIRDWLLTDPAPEQLQAVFRELSGRDKGAAKPVRDRLDEQKRARHQVAAATEWAQKAEHLLQLPRLNLADALAWQRDAAKAGAPLAREPLAELKSKLADRVKGIEDLQNRVQVQREAAVLLAQRLEVLSTKPRRDAQGALPVLQADVAHWREQADALTQDTHWISVDARFPPLLDASRTQLQGVWDAFAAAIAQAIAAATDAAAPLPPVPVWADELRGERGMPAAAAAPSQAAVDPEARTRANDAVQTALQALDHEVKEGHVKASAGAATALRAALKEHARLIDHALEQRAQAALATAGELEGWQRWRADQLREELVRQAEALLGPPPEVPVKLRKAGSDRNRSGAKDDIAGRPGEVASPATAGTADAAASANALQSPHDAQAATLGAPSEAPQALDAAGKSQQSDLSDATRTHQAADQTEPGNQADQADQAAATPELAAEAVTPIDWTPPEPSDVATPPSTEADAAAQLDEWMVTGRTSDDAQQAEDRVEAAAAAAGSAKPSADAIAAEASSEVAPAPETAPASSIATTTATAAAATAVDTALTSRTTSPAIAPRPPTPPNIDAPRKPRMGGRKLQETLRSLREQWRQVDKGGPPNHGLWRRFDHACNEAHKFVEEWLEQVRAQAAEHRGQRLALIEEVTQWAADNRTAKDEDWKGFARIVREFGERWRASGHLNEKAFAELQPQWKQALQNAAAPLEEMQKASEARRQAMIEEAIQLGAAPMLRIDAVKSLQQRWQAEAQRVPMDRRHEQKLWDTFRKPIDEAFNRKTAEREHAAAAMGERDRAVLDASKALEAANASGDAQAIKSAMAGLDAALRGQADEAARADKATQLGALAPATGQASNAEKSEPDVPNARAQRSSDATEDVASPDAAATTDATGKASGDNSAVAPAQGGVSASADAASTAANADKSADGGGEDTAAESTPPAPAEVPKPMARPVVAVRGDDRPGMRKAEPAAPGGRSGKFGDRRDAGGGRSGPPGAGRPGGGRDDRGDRGSDRDGRFGAARPDFADRGPRLGDVAFRAQRDALEHAQNTLKKLAAQAHGEALTELMDAWQQRDPDKIPNAQTLGQRVAPATRSQWASAIRDGATTKSSTDLATALLRLEIAAEAPTPAEHVSARRLLQLQLLTRRHDAGPTETWGADAAAVLASPFDAAHARRLQNALKTLLRN